MSKARKERLLAFLNAVRNDLMERRRIARYNRHYELEEHHLYNANVALDIIADVEGLEPC
jgi:hypothetical protein